MILQTGLQDWYVQYTLFVALEQPAHGVFVLDVLHANIQDGFNEHGVQIMSPRYVMDPPGAQDRSAGSLVCAPGLPSRVRNPAGTDSDRRR